MEEWKDLGNERGKVFRGALCYFCNAINRKLADQGIIRLRMVHENRKERLHMLVMSSRAAELDEVIKQAKCGDPYTREFLFDHDKKAKGKPKTMEENIQ